MNKQKRDELIVQNMGYARSLSRGFSGAHNLDHIEAESAAMMALVIASNDYDLESKARFRTYATHKILGYMRHSLDVEIKHDKRRHLNAGQLTHTPEQQIQNRIEAKRILDFIDDEDAKEVLIREALGDKHAEIARDKKVAASTIKRRRDRAKNQALLRIS